MMLRTKVEEECDYERMTKRAEQLWTLELQDKDHRTDVSKPEIFSSLQSTQDVLKTMLQEEEDLEVSNSL